MKYLISYTDDLGRVHDPMLCIPMLRVVFPVYADNQNLLEILRDALMANQFVLLGDLAAGGLQEIVSSVKSDLVMVCLQPQVASHGMPLGPEITLPLGYKVLKPGETFE